MKKVKKFKELCSEMEQRKKNLDEELREYNQKVNHIRNLGGFVSCEDKIIDSLDSIPHKLKREYEYLFSQIHEHIRSQSQWINEINQAYMEAQDEILECVQQKTQSQDMFNHIRQTMERIAQVNRLAAIEYGEDATSSFPREDNN